MDRAALQELRAFIEQFLKMRGFELVDIYYKYEGGRMVLGILADRVDGGITLGECGMLNREISVLMEEKDMIVERYVLEVSSPGMDRPLITKEDFRRCAGKEVIAYLRQTLEGKTEIRGVIKEVSDTHLALEAQGSFKQISLDNISKAKQVVS